MTTTRRNNLRLEVRTGEGVVISYDLASPLRRMLAICIDLSVITLLNTVFSIVPALFGLVSTGLAVAISIAGQFVISVGYGIFLEWTSRGQTLGKRVLQLRVIDASGRKLTFEQVALRNLLRVVDLLPGFYLTGGLVAFLSAKAQRLGDLAAGTVVWHRRPKWQTLPEDDLVKYNSLRAYPHLEARLRQVLHPEEVDVLVQALQRRKSLDPSDRLALFAMLAGDLQARCPFPESVRENVSPEQYVRNCLDSVLNQAKQKAW